MKHASCLKLPPSETGRWLVVREWVFEFCVKWRAQGYTPADMVAEITGQYPDRSLEWNEAQFICIDSLLRERPANQ